MKIGQKAAYLQCLSLLTFDYGNCTLAHVFYQGNHPLEEAESHIQ
jgi:hypothetical protein